MGVKMARIVLTTHAKERMMQRRISQTMIEQVIQKADSNEKESDGDTQFAKRINGRKVEVVAMPIERGDWLIKTVWVEGEGDASPLWTLISKLLARFWR
jgi:hypothetical protein